jgi:AmiR/NasT family two-component response regulator
LSELPVVLVVIRDDLHLEHLMQNLKAQGLVAFGTSSEDEAIRLMSRLRPEVVVIDPTSDECSEVFDVMGSRGWQSMGLVAVVESGDAARRAQEMGIDEVIMADDSFRAADAVMRFLHQVSPSIS